MKKQEHNNDFMEVFLPNSTSYIKTVRQDMFTHLIKLDSLIGEPSNYRELIDLLYMADEDVEFIFLINSGGGNLSTAMAIIEAIKATEGKVRAIITGECHSAASLITLNCHEIVITDSAHSLIHTASYGTGGNTHMVQTHVDFSSKMINKIIDNTYTGFLTETELVDVKKGVEIWMDADQLRERMESRSAYLASLKEESPEEIAPEETE